MIKMSQVGLSFLSLLCFGLIRKEKEETKLNQTSVNKLDQIYLFLFGSLVSYAFDNVWSWSLRLVYFSNKIRRI